MEGEGRECQEHILEVERLRRQSREGTTPGKEDDSMEGGGRERLEHVLEVE